MKGERESRRAQQAYHLAAPRFPMVDARIRQRGGDPDPKAPHARLSQQRTQLKDLDLAGGVFLLLHLLWLTWLLWDVCNGSARLWPILAATGCFQGANRFLAGVVESRPGGLRKLAQGNGPLFVNTGVSLLHSSIVGMSVSVLLVKEWSRSGLSGMMQHQQLFGGCWPGIFKLLCFTSGYFAYDQWDMLQYRLYSPKFPSILVHHAVLLLCFTLALRRDVTLNYLALTLICEVHSILLHQRKVAKLAGLRTGGTATANLLWFVNWTTFLLFRLLPHSLITWKLVKDAALFPQGIELPLALMGMIVLNVLNYGLGMDLYKAFRRDFSGRHKTAA